MPSVGNRNRASSESAAITAVLQSFNTWAFKREQPSSVELLHAHVATAVSHRGALPFVLYWGKGPRSEIAPPDLECLDYLEKMALRIAGAYPPGAHLTLVCTDTHALHNGHSPMSIQKYFSQIASAANERGFATCRLGSLSPLSALIEMVPVSMTMPSESFQRLIVAAERWYRGDHSAEDGALQYYRMNMVEKRAIERAFPNAIFITFNGSNFRDLFPDSLPIFYMYSTRRGVAVKPWFMDETSSSPQHPPDSLVADQA